MNPRPSHLDTLNVHAEASRLAPDLLVRWQGLPVGWFDAGATAQKRDFVVPRPLLALLDTGVAQARFDFGSGAKVYDFSAGAMRIFDGRRTCRLNDWSCRSARRIMVELDAIVVDEPEALAGLRQDLEFRDDALAAVVRAMAHEIEQGCPHGALYAESLSIGVVLRVARTHGGTRSERGALTATQLRRVDELIADGSEGGPTLGALAAAAGYSKAHFVRLFRRTTGTSPHRYVLRRRLGRDVFPLDESFLAALDRIGAAGGVAVGFDRLLMLLTGAETIADVLLFPAVEEYPRARRAP